MLMDWLDNVPTTDRRSLLGSIKSGDNHAFDSAFWELYLHEAYRRSGHQVSIHPDLPNSSFHPDFLVEGETGRFYLEAVRVGIAAHKVAETRRLNEVHAVLDQMSPDRFMIGLSHYSIGPRPLPTTKLREQVKRWLGSLDPVAVADDLAKGFYQDLPKLVHEVDGWRLEIEALPLKPEAYGKPGRLVGMHGEGEAQIVDNVTGLRKALSSKAKKYGVLDAPLVIAVMSNTDYPTDDREVEQALFGLSAWRPALAALHAARLREDGHWLTRKGWRCGHAPQVIAVQDLKPWLVNSVKPRLWSTLEPGVPLATQPTWLAQVEVDAPKAKVAPARQPPSMLFGLPADWRPAEAFEDEDGES
ncbi:hypothetical protein [Longispora urticae]